jgi:hypothetical protein
MNGLFSQAIAKRNKKTNIHFTKGLFAPAIAELKRDLETVETNEPINESEKDEGQADLERENAKSFRAAIKVLEHQ